jgi:hypothetical protein
MKPVVMLANAYRPANKLRPGRCPICTLKTHDMVGDHCHESGLSREWICRKCNTGLGMFKDNPEALERAAVYLRKHRERHDTGSTIDHLRAEYARCHPKGARI